MYQAFLFRLRSAHASGMSATNNNNKNIVHNEDRANENEEKQW